MPGRRRRSRSTLLGVAEDEHEQERGDDQDVPGDHEHARPAVAADVAGGDEGKHREDAVLGDRVGDERELDLVLIAP